MSGSVIVTCALQAQERPSLELPIYQSEVRFLFFQDIKRANCATQIQLVLKHVMKHFTCQSRIEPMC